jgi:hypothetical protein
MESEMKTSAEVQLAQPTMSDMKRDKKSPNGPPQFDYGLALQRAVSWLGDRYLLAEPARRLNEAPKPYFVESRSWHPATRH